MFVVLGFWLSGCVEVTEEIWFEPDGQSRVELSVGYTDVADRLLGVSDLRSQSRDRFEELETYARTQLGARSVHISEYAQGRKHFTKLAATLPDAEAAERLLQQFHAADGSAADDAVQASNTVRITPEFGGRLRYEHRLSMEMRDEPQPASPAEQALAESLTALIFADARIRIRVHGAEIIDAIGESSADSTMVEWTIPIVEMLRGGSIDRRMSADLRVRPPYEWWTLAGFGALLGLVLIRRII